MQQVTPTRFGKNMNLRQLFVPFRAPWYNGEAPLLSRVIEIFDVWLFDSARDIVDSIDAVARTIVAAHSTSTACGHNKEGTGSTVSSRSLLFSTASARHCVHNCLCTLTWISSIEGADKSSACWIPCSNLPPTRTVLLHQSTQASLAHSA
jgi:hypothetical protein